MNDLLDWLVPDWPAPASVKAVVTTRQGGVSEGAYESLNLAAHVNDHLESVELNRVLMSERLGFAADSVCWVNQVHGVEVVDAATTSNVPDADASFCRTPGRVCAVLTADCLPVLFCDVKGKQVAAAHAGWRGLLDGVLEATLKTFADPASVMVWLGPAIGPDAFEVGAEVRDAFIQKQANAASCFVASDQRQNHWLGDLYTLARKRLEAAGVTQISGGTFCTYTDATRFYSYRRDHVTGRMASLIWIAPHV